MFQSEGQGAMKGSSWSIEQMNEQSIDPDPSDELLQAYFDFNKTINMSKEIIPESFTSLDGTRSIKTTYTLNNGARNYIYYWTKMIEKYPEMFDETNALRIRRGEAPIANEQWISYNPSHAKWKMEKLEHHHWLQGKKAGALPMPLHRGKGYTKMWHQFKSRGGIQSIGFVIVSALDVAGAINGNPDNIYSYFRIPEVGKIYFDYVNGDTYFVPSTIQKTIDSNGKVTQMYVCYDRYRYYVWDDEQGKYIGTVFIESKCEIYNIKTKSGGYVSEKQFL